VLGFESDPARNPVFSLVFHIFCPGPETIRSSNLGRCWAVVGTGWAMVGFWSSSHRDGAGIQESGRHEVVWRLPGAEN
jgi:hypothetical protein